MHTLTRYSLSSVRLFAVGSLIWFSNGGLATAVGAEAEYTPTMKDMMSINATFHRYKMGLDKNDEKLLKSAFTVGGVDKVIDPNMPAGGMPGGPPGGAGGAPGGAGGPPGGAAGAGGMPQGGPPSGGADGAPSGAMPQGAPGGGAPGGAPGGAGGMPGGAPGGAGGGAPGGGGGAPKGIFHFSSDDYFHFDSPTHATHYAYWWDASPGTGRDSRVGTPGHYEDVLVKVNGEWLIKERLIYVNTK